MRHEAKELSSESEGVTPCQSGFSPALRMSAPPDRLPLAIIEIAFFPSSPIGGFFHAATPNLVDPSGFEPLTSSMPLRRSTN